MQVPSNIWTSTERLLIIIPYTNEDEFKKYRSSLDNLLNNSNVKELKILVVLPNSLKKETLIQHKLIRYLSIKDLSFFGKVKDAELASLINKPFDTLLWMGVDNKKIAKLFSKAPVKWKIGVNTPLDLFTIRIDCNSEKPEEIINFAKKTLEKISSIDTE